MTTHTETSQRLEILASAIEKFGFPRGLTEFDPAPAAALLRSAADSISGSEKALELAVRFGGIDGDHHKAWVIDQMVRALTGDRYEQVVADACDGEDGPDTYYWDEGVAP